MTATVSLHDLLAAYDWVNAGASAGVEGEAYVSRLTGEVHWVGEGCDDEPPEDIGDESLYVAVPGQSDLDLGRPLALRFVRERLPDSYDTVRGIFSARGAYTRFKSLLDGAGMLDAWYQYEQSAVAQALSEWCAENGFALAA